MSGKSREKGEKMGLEKCSDLFWAENGEKVGKGCFYSELTRHRKSRNLPEIPVMKSGYRYPEK